MSNAKLYKREYPVSTEEIIEELKGSCKSLHEVLYLNEMEDAEDDIEFCRDVDAEVFCCCRCNWWSEISEAVDVGNDFACTDCADD